MTNENHSQDFNFLAQAAKPEEFEGEQIEPINDPAKSLRIGLLRLYLNNLREIKRLRKDNLINDKRADELTARIDEMSARDLGYEISREVTLELAKEIMGQKMFFGPDEVRKAGVEIYEGITAIPFNLEELEQAKELGQMLIYRTSTTMKELEDAISPRLTVEGKGKLIGDMSWCTDSTFYIRDWIQPGWALVSKELNPDSTDKDYLEQNELLAEYLVNEVFKGKPLPGKYQAAVDQFNSQKKAIRLIMDNGDDYEHLKSSQMLANLGINLLFRQSPVEVVYDLLVYFQNTGERLHERDFVWASSQTSPGYLATVGKFKIEGADVDGYKPNVEANNLGFSFSRRGADLKS